MNILLSSIGRRGYLASWFRTALRANGQNGLVYAADASPLAPGLHDADAMLQLPRFDAPNYLTSLKSLLIEHNIGLALSVNDYELQLWSEHSAWLSDNGTRVLALPQPAQQIVADKLKMAEALTALGITSPTTVSAGDFLRNPAILDGVDTIVIKHRFGSGSHGIMACRVSDLASLLPFAARGVRNETGQSVQDSTHAYEYLILQEYIAGVELGLDVLNDFSGTYVGVLARRKLRMRAGETDAVETIPPAPYEPLAAAISRALGHAGPVDIDVIAAETSHFVIDINPRFGGGYPFSHAAGADVPAACLAWAQDLPAPPEALSYHVGIRAAKQDRVIITDGAIRQRGTP